MTMTTAEMKGYIKKNAIDVFNCAARKSTLVLSGLFLELTRQFYSDEENLFKGVTKYDPSGECSICIDSSYTWDPDNTDCRPSIVVDIGDLKYSRQKMEGMGGMHDYDLKEGERIHCRLATGSVIFAHLASEKAEAMNYANNTFDLFDGFAKVIKDDFGFEKFDLRSILRPRLRKETPRDYECLVQADFQFQETFRVKHESPKLKQVSMKAASSLIQQFRMVK